jgi:hypothetical protein
MQEATRSSTDRPDDQKSKGESIDSQPLRDNVSTFDLKTILLLTSVFLCVFLIGLDRTIVSTVSSKPSSLQTLTP